MAYPTDMSTRVVKGTFIDIDGQTSTGTVSFTPSAVVRDFSDATILYGTTSVELDANGYFEIALPCTDDTDLLPDDWYYTIRIRLQGARSVEWNMELPYADGSEVNISDVGGHQFW